MRADADAEHDASRRDDVERGHLLCDQHGAVHRKHEHAEGQPHPFRDRRRRRQRHHHLRIGKRDALAGAQARERSRVDAARPAENHFAIQARHHHRQVESDLHTWLHRNEAQ
jgi:hypothetical protein